MVAHRSHADCSRCKRPVSGLLAWRFTAVRTWLFCALFALLTHPSSAQSVDGQKRVTAVRVPTGSVHVDGNLDDEVWRLASPVWEARVRIDEGGWVAELRIPFDQLRFRNVDAQNWGLNIYRLIPWAERGGRLVARAPNRGRLGVAIRGTPRRV